MQIYLARKSKKYLFHYFYIFYPCSDNFVQSGEFYPWKILFTKDFIKSREFYQLKILSSLGQILLCSVDTFIRCVDFYPVQILLSRAQTLIHCVDLYSVQILLSGVQTFIKCRYFYPARRLMSSVDTFVQCVDLCPVQIILFSAQTFIQCRYFYLERRLFFLTKQRTLKLNLECNQINIKGYIKDFLKQLIVFFYLNFQLAVPSSEN